MNTKKLFGISLAMAILLGSISFGFSEPLRVQLEQGIDIDHLQCNNLEHVLVLRTNGNLVCVTERTSEKTGWEIVGWSDEILPISESTLEEKIERIENSDIHPVYKNEKLSGLIMQLEVRKYIENNGWPEYSDEQVITQATEFIEPMDYLFTETEEYGKLCGLVLYENLTVGKMIIEDKPYHDISMGYCGDFEYYGLESKNIKVIINAENSTDIHFWWYGQLEG